MKPDDLALYHFDSCPFCGRVREALARLDVELELRDIERDTQHHADLVAATGRRTVPCLRIEQSSGDVRWMHESADIIDYLQERFGSA